MWKKENLRKNFLRVKQMADQNLGRAEKSEVLTEDQQGNERRVEVVRQVSHNLIKKVGALLEAPGTDYDKRLKKLPETGLSHTFTESAGMLGPDTLLGSICQQCGDCQAVLATKELQCEIDIENKVLTPLQTIAEIDIPSIMKHRKQLAKSTLDMDSAKSRFNSAVRQSQAQGTNMASAAAKADALRDEHDEACNRVEAIKDNLSIELCNFVARESEHSARLVALLEAQATYHKNALKVIEDAIPKMKATIEKSPLKPVFGMALEEHLKMMGRDVSLVLEACILTLIDIGMEEEGLFRIAGSALKLKKLRACIDAHALDMEEFSNEPHTVAGVLKQYLRELPEPLMTYNLCKEFMDASQLPPDQRFKSLQAIVNKLPPANYNNIRYLVKFLQLLAEKSQINKMTPSNIAIVMGPNLLWAKGESAPNMMTTGAVSSIIESFIIHADQFFPGELDFHLTGQGRAPPSPSIVPPSAKELPVVSVFNAEDEPDSPKQERASELRTVTQPGESTLVQIAEGGSTEALNTSEPDVLSLDLGSESSGEVVMSGVGPGTRAMSSSHRGDGVLPALAPATNLSLAPNSARKRPIMSAPCPPGSAAWASSPNLTSLSMGSAPPLLLSPSSLSRAQSITSHASPVPPMSPSQSVHSDMYTTLFALHSLEQGGEAWSNYQTRVRSLLDGQFQSGTLAPPSPSEREKLIVSQPGAEQSSPRPQANQRNPSPSPSPMPTEPEAEAATEKVGAALDGSVDECQGRSAEAKGSQDFDFNETGAFSPDSPGQDFRHDNPVMTASSPSVLTHSTTPNSGSPVPNSASPAANSLSPANDSPEGPQTSPKVQRRLTKKPAPPPPPDRSYTVAVTASMSKATGNGGLTSMTWHRSAPLNSPQPSADQAAYHHGEGDRRHSPPERRTSGHERPHGPPPERPERPSAPPPERPKAPPTLQTGTQHPPGAPGGHQRSASTGAMHIITTASPSPVTKKTYTSFV
ncbi:rho GTPase-activating protein 44-like isoform X1 [Littorina saxatilis]|uniref:rho GTPase-activating protein 44-like isoform X1 n=1 Tax=Littorina saxatilis TaxID=31220 RepID=UPI0038B62BE5